MIQMLKKFKRKIFGSTKYFLIWLVLLIVTLVLLNNLAGKSYGDLQTPLSKRLTENFNKSVVKKEVRTSLPKLGGSCDPQGAKCPAGYISYLIKSGQGKDQSPLVCFNGEYIIDSEKQNAKRGLNIVVINDKTLEVEDVRSFDTYESDALLKRYLLLGIPETFLVIVATLDDGAYSLSKDSRKMLSSYGSRLIHDLGFRDNFVMLGQRTLLEGESLEKISVRAVSTEFASEVEIKGCASIPIGKLGDLSITKVPLGDAIGIENPPLGAGLINCGVPETCDENSFSVHMYTGSKSDDMCKLCINGRYIFAKDLNQAGRGINVAVISPKTKDVIKLARFDTFTSSSSTAELFLEMLDEKDIVIAMVHDEASTNLNVHMQRQFENLGSSLISKLSFRDVWVFVGQKGINGKSPIEELSQAKSDWPTPIDKRLCVPINLSGQVSREASARRSAKKKFCIENKDVLDERFCSAENLEKLLEPVPHVHNDWVTNDIYKVPVIIIPGSNYKSFQLQIESLFTNPGIKKNMINVILDRKQSLYMELAEIYGVRSHSIVTNANSYEKFFRAAFEKAWNLYPYEKSLIFLEEEVIPTSDFLTFINQCLTSDFMSDGTLLGISAWTHHRVGYGLTKTWYRSDFFPGLGFLMKRGFYVEYLKGKMANCCTNRTWFGWKVEDAGNKEIICPDAPRAYRVPYKKPAEPSAQDEISSKLFATTSPVTQDFSVLLSDTNMIPSSKYETYLEELIKKGSPFNQSSVMSCLKNGSKILPKKSSGHNSLFRLFTIFYKQSKADDFTLAYKLANCFEFHPIQGLPIPNMRRGLLRISQSEDEIILVGSLTEYFQHKPKDASLIEL